MSRDTNYLLDKRKLTILTKFHVPTICVGYWETCRPKFVSLTFLTAKISTFKQTTLTESRLRIYIYAFWGLHSWFSLLHTFAQSGYTLFDYLQWSWGIKKQQNDPKNVRSNSSKIASRRGISDRKFQFNGLFQQPVLNCLNVLNV